MLPDTDIYYSYNSERNVNILRIFLGSYEVETVLSLPESLVRGVSASLLLSNIEITEDLAENSNVIYILLNGNNEISKGIIESCDFYSSVSLFSLLIDAR